MRGRGSDLRDGSQTPRVGRYLTHQINLVGARVGLVSAGKAKESVLGCLGHGVGRETRNGRHGGGDVTGDAVEAIEGG